MRGYSRETVVRVGVKGRKANVRKWLKIFKLVAKKMAK